MGKLSIEAPVEGDFDYMHINLCQEDRDELEKIAGVDASQIKDKMLSYFRNSFVCFTIISQDTLMPLGMFGCVASEQDVPGSSEVVSKQIVGYPWLLTTGEFNKYPKEAIQLARAWVDQFKRHFSYLHVIASEEHPTSVPFLKQLGFREDIKINLPDLKGKVYVNV